MKYKTYFIETQPMLVKYVLIYMRNVCNENDHNVYLSTCGYLKIQKLIIYPRYRMMQQIPCACCGLALGGPAGAPGSSSGLVSTP